MSAELRLTYGSWFRHRKKVNKVQSEDDARKSHEAKELYFVTIYQGEKPFCFLEINNTFFNIGFLDEFDREYLRYEFNEYESGKLFMTEAQYWEYEGNSDKKINSTIYYFSQDGTVRLNKADLVSGEEENSEAKGVDLSKNYEDYPDFGDYSKLIVKER